jgi:hypothetical protein
MHTLKVIILTSTHDLGCSIPASDDILGKFVIFFAITYSSGEPKIANFEIAV